MDAIAVYKCLCNRTRLRILHLLREGPLCVCHLQDILEESQVKMSKHLGYLRRNGLIESERKANWTIYRLPERTNKLLEENLKCLQDVFSEDSVFRRDMKRLRRTDTSMACGPIKSCC